MSRYGVPRRGSGRVVAAALSWALLAVACNGTAAIEPDQTATPAPVAAPPAPGGPASPLPPSPDLVFDSARAWQHLERQVAFGPRPSGSAPLEQTRQYLLGELKRLGITTRQQAFVARTPLGDVAMANLIGTIPGRRPERIALASHYDTKLFRDIRFVGASDGASSTAAVLELARVLAQRQNEFTIDLLFFDGEEAVVEWYRDNDNTYGSRHYVQMAQQDGSIRGLRALVLLDMIGDSDLMIRRDANSTPWLVDVIWNAAARLGHASTFSNELTSIDDDHIPFLRAGIPAVDVIDLDDPAWHTADDTLANVSPRSLQIVGDVILAALPDIEQRLR